MLYAVIFHSETVFQTESNILVPNHPKMALKCEFLFSSYPRISAFRGKKLMWGFVLHFVFEPGCSSVL